MKKRIVLVLMLVCVLVLVGCSNSNNDDYGALESEKVYCMGFSVILYVWVGWLF